MIKIQIHFKNYDLAVPVIREIKTDYIVFSKMNRSKENGLLLTIEIDEQNLNSHLELIESFQLETY